MAARWVMYITLIACSDRGVHVMQRRSMEYPVNTVNGQHSVQHFTEHLTVDENGDPSRYLICADDV